MAVAVGEILMIIATNISRFPRRYTLSAVKSW
jgi:hypothetical protein